MVKDELKKLIDDVHYLIIAHCKYKDMSMYDRALKQFQEDINYGQLEEMSYDERFAFLLGLEISLKAIENAITLSEQLKGNPDMIKSFSSLLPPPEDGWEMKCPFKYWDEYWFVLNDGDIEREMWGCTMEDVDRFNIGNVFPTEEAALLEVKRRNLLTRFRAFRDECNGNWKPDWSNRDEKWEIDYTEEEVKALWTSGVNSFSTFGYFKNKQDTQRAIELFGDEIKELFVDCEG